MVCSMPVSGDAVMDGYYVSFERLYRLWTHKQRYDAALCFCVLDPFERTLYPTGPALLHPVAAFFINRIEFFAGTQTRSFLSKL